MKRVPKSVFLFFPLFALFALHPLQTGIAPRSASSTPTYDPLVEPPLPEHPTEFELGRNLYWHWCMTCHGDHGQGLTDEFRSIWEPEHQNCWGRGCHAGRPGDEGFPIPTVVPALVSESQLARFASVQELADFLHATHPPQSPGVLKDDDYLAIALFVFRMNEKSLTRSIPIVVPVASATENYLTPQKSSGSPYFVPVAVIIGLTMLVPLAFLLIRQVFDHKDNDSA